MSEIDKLARIIRMTLAIFVGVTILRYFLPYGLDSTDRPDGTRSGMSVYIDYKTGCQYLATPLGSLTPRLNGAGKQEGCKTP